MSKNKDALDLHFGQL